MRIIFNRLKEGSTWRGLILLVTVLGAKLNPEQQEATVALGLAIVGAIGVFWPEKKPAPEIEVRKAEPVVSAKKVALNPNHKG